MRIIEYSKEDLEKIYSPETPLKEIFQHIENEHFKNGEVVCQFIVNEMPLLGGEETRLSHSQIQEVKSLQVVIEHLENLPTEVLTGCIKEIPQLIEVADQVAGNIRFNGIENHYSAFVKVIDSIRYLMESLNLIESHLTQIPNFTPDKWKDVSQRTVNSVHEMWDSLQKKDSVRLADTMEYDINESLNSWKELLDELQPKMKAP